MFYNLSERSVYGKFWSQVVILRIYSKRVNIWKFLILTIHHKKKRLGPGVFYHLGCSKFFGRGFPDSCLFFLILLFIFTPKYFSTTSTNSKSVKGFAAWNSKSAAWNSKSVKGFCCIIIVSCALINLKNFPFLTFFLLFKFIKKSRFLFNILPSSSRKLDSLKIV